MNVGTTTEAFAGTPLSSAEDEGIVLTERLLEQ
ncbi:MAG: hypothetical protein JWO23_1088 [Solirubrobacterales bacterium]|nr:hypothetical protein [Solirubrobacterales bacterium]